jgi:transcriptional regulator with XRE-family HTH domain
MRSGAVAKDIDPFEGLEPHAFSDLDVESRFVELFKQRRLARDMSQAHAAAAIRELGVSMDPTGITRLEGGERRLRLNEALALSLAVGSDLVSMIAAAMSPDFRRQILLDEEERLKIDSGVIDEALSEVYAQLKALDKPKGRGRGAR